MCVDVGRLALGDGEPAPAAPTGAAPAHLVALVVDEDAADRRDTVALLQQAGARAVAVATRAEALDEVTRRRFDLVVVALAPPATDGVELCQALKQSPRFVGVPVVLVSGAAETAGRAAAAEAGADEWFRKPLGATGFDRRLGALLRRRAALRLVEAYLGPRGHAPALRRFLVAGLGLSARRAWPAGSARRRRAHELKRIGAVVEDLLDLGREDRTRVALHRARVRAARCGAS
jgi:DNA-binding response OmpR family regulator